MESSDNVGRLMILGGSMTLSASLPTHGYTWTAMGSYDDTKDPKRSTFHQPWSPGGVLTGRWGTEPRSPTRNSIAETENPAAKAQMGNVGNSREYSTQNGANFPDAEG